MPINLRENIVSNVDILSIRKKLSVSPKAPVSKSTFDLLKEIENLKKELELKNSKLLRKVNWEDFNIAIKNDLTFLDYSTSSVDVTIKDNIDFTSSHKTRLLYNTYKESL